jgi:hypothetical protein
VGENNEKSFNQKKGCDMKCEGQNVFMVSIGIWSLEVEKAFSIIIKKLPRKLPEFIPDNVLGENKKKVFVCGLLNCFCTLFYKL